MNRKFEVFEKKGDAIMLPTVTFKCPFCGTPLVMHQEGVYEYRRTMIVKTDKGEERKVKQFYHCDIHMKCPSCDWFTVFGVPVSKDEFEKLKKSKWIGVIFTEELLNDLTDLNEDEKKVIEERLKALGYW